VATILSRRYDHERKSQEREDRQEVLDRPDELPHVHTETRPVGRKHKDRQPQACREGWKMKKPTKEIKKDKKFWADPMCYPVFATR
jgi:hypothetical protein